MSCPGFGGFVMRTSAPLVPLARSGGNISTGARNILHIQLYFPINITILIIILIILNIV